MIYFILGLSIMLNIATILVIVVSYKRIKAQILTPKIEKNFDLNSFINDNMKTIFGKGDQDDWTC